MQGIVDFFTRFDYQAWYYINTQWHDPLFDAILPYFRNQWFWVPLYFFLALYMPTAYKKKGWIWCLFFFVSFVISDRISAGWLKPHFHRLRPCHRQDLSQVIHMVVECGGMYGFPSSHAANHFSIGIFSAVSMGKLHSWVWPAAIIWAVLVCYCQVYVGVHFPMDVVTGGAIGACTGFIMGFIFNKVSPINHLPGALPA